MEIGAATDNRQHKACEAFGWDCELDRTGKFFYKLLLFLSFGRCWSWQFYCLSYSLQIRDVRTAQSRNQFPLFRAFKFAIRTRKLPEGNCYERIVIASSATFQRKLYCFVILWQIVIWLQLIHYSICPKRRRRKCLKIRKSFESKYPHFSVAYHHRALSKLSHYSYSTLNSVVVVRFSVHRSCFPRGVRACLESVALKWKVSIREMLQHAIATRQVTESNAK